VTSSREDSHLQVDAHVGRTRGRDGDCSPPPHRSRRALALGRAIIAVGTYNTVSTSVSAYLNVAKDGGNLAEVNREAPNTAGY
jgi:hypothetical protein